MNAKNVTPDETAPEQPTSVDVPTTAEAPSTAREGSAPDPIAKPVVSKKTKPTVTTATTPATSTTAGPRTDALTSADDVVVTKAAVPAKSTATGEIAPVTAEATGEVTPVVAHTGEVTPVHAPVQTVYVTAPTPPRQRGNRGIGVLVSVLATIVFAAVYLGAVALLTLFVDPSGVTSAVSTFVMSPFFYVPVVVFLVAMVLWALLANRASWWSWIVGSLVIALVTYFASIGIFLLMQGGFGMTASAATFAFIGFALDPALVAAALIARECAIWFGAMIAKRGRKVRERNYEAWQSFEHEEAKKRAEFGGAAAA